MSSAVFRFPKANDSTSISAKCLGGVVGREAIKDRCIITMQESRSSTGSKTQKDVFLHSGSPRNLTKSK